MTCLLSATDLAIKIAAQEGTLSVERKYNPRIDSNYWAIADDHGIIEVAMDHEIIERLGDLGITLEDDASEAIRPRAMSMEVIRTAGGSLTSEQKEKLAAMSDRQLDRMAGLINKLGVTAGSLII